MGFIENLRNLRKSASRGQEEMTSAQKEQLEYLTKIQSEFEAISKKAVNFPVGEEAIKFYAENFDEKERVLGSVFVAEKVLPQVSVWVREKVSEMVLNNGVKLEDLTKECDELFEKMHKLHDEIDKANLKKEKNKTFESKISKGQELETEKGKEIINSENLINEICNAKDETGSTLINRAQEILFNDDYPYPYRDGERSEINKVVQKRAPELTKLAIAHLIKGATTQVEDLSHLSGQQLAILEELTNRFNTQTRIESGFPVSYDVEEELKSISNKPTIRFNAREGTTYKEEMKLYILQNKYEMMLNSGKYSKDSKEIKLLEEQIKKLYQAHLFRVPKLEKEHLACLEKKLKKAESETSKREKPRNKEYMDNLKNRIKKSKSRISKRKSLWNSTLKPRILKQGMPERKFINIPGISRQDVELTKLEALTMLEGYHKQKEKIKGLKLPPKNISYVAIKKENTFNGISTPFFNEADKKEPEQELDG